MRLVATKVYIHRGKKGSGKGSRYSSWGRHPLQFGRANGGAADLESCCVEHVDQCKKKEKEGTGKEKFNRR